MGTKAGGASDKKGNHAAISYSHRPGDARGDLLSTDIGVVPAISEWREHYMPVMAPSGVALALI
jgi:hypothetical protein